MQWMNFHVLHVKLGIHIVLLMGIKDRSVSLIHSHPMRFSNRFKMPRLNRTNRNIAIGLLEAGQSQRTVARRMAVHQTTISRLWARYRQHNSVEDRPRSGRPRVTTRAQDRYIRVHHLRHRTATATSTASNIPGLRRLSAQTVRNRLREVGLRARRPYFGPVLRQLHRRRRVQWCNNVQAWTLANWRRIWFSDESRFLLERRDGRMRVYRRRHERFANACVPQVDRFGRGSVMMWGAISYTGRSDLIMVRGHLTALRYRDEILRPHLLPILNRQRELFQQDNARPHTARVTRDFLTTENVTVLPWPSRSPDLNPIEHLWDVLDRRVRQRNPAPQTLQQLAIALEAEWTAIPQQQIQRLIRSMSRRCRAVLDSNGGHNRY